MTQWQPEQTTVKNNYYQNNQQSLTRSQTCTYEPESNDMYRQIVASLLAVNERDQTDANK